MYCQKNIKFTTSLNGIKMVNIRGLYNQWLTIARYRVSSKDSKYLLSSLLKERPQAFYSIHTQYGWFIIPKEYYAYRWTAQNIQQSIENRYPDIVEKPRSHEALQEVVDQWGRETDLTQKPAVRKTTKADIEKHHLEALYRSQLREESREDTSSKKSTRERTVVRKRNPGTITFTHAWNYFFSVSNPKYKHLGRKEARKEVAQEWNNMTTDEKEEYRGAYAELLAEGKDVYRGNIVPKEEKLKKQKKTTDVN